jgi:serine/threonine-protein kinase
MGQVFRARDLVTKAMVAVKIIHPHRSVEGRHARRFAVEALALRRIEHPNVVRWLAAGTEEGCNYIVMELVDGHNLHRVLRSRGALEPEYAAKLCIKLCDALTAVHAAGVIHRDVKPSNVLLERVGSHDVAVKLGDFGLARLSGVSVTVGNEAIGTPMFMAPEQALGEAADVRTDVHGVGIVLFMMLAGRNPFMRASKREQLALSVFAHPQPPSLVKAGVPPELDPVVLSALRKNPNNRYQSAREVRTDLERFLALRPGKPKGAELVAVPDAYEPQGPFAQRLAPILHAEYED